MAGLLPAPRRAPKLTVTRWLLCFLASVSFLLVVLCGFDSEIKRAGGRRASPQLAPPCGRTPRIQGGVWGGELFTIFRGAPGAGPQSFSSFDRPAASGRKD